MTERSVRPRTIFLVANNITELGGVQKVAHQLAQNFARVGHTVHLIGIYDVAEPVRYVDEPLYTTTTLYDGDAGHGPPWQPRRLRERANLTARRAELRRVALRAAAVRRLDQLFAATPSGLVIVMQVWAMGWVAEADHRHLRVIGQSHESYEASRGLTGASTGSTRYRRMRQLFTDVDLFQLLTRADAEKFERDGWNNVSVMPNPLSFYPDRVSDLTEKTVISVGRYHPQKNYRALLDAWVEVSARHPDWRLKIFGRGPEEDLLREHARSRGIADTARLMGPTAQVQQELLASSVFALSSDFEGLPLVLGEAMACGVPCVSVECSPGIREIIADGHDGFVVPPRRPAALAEAICRLIEDDDLRRSMGSAARENIARFSTANILRRWEQVFDLVER